MSANTTDGKPKNIWAFIETLMCGDVRPRSSADDDDPPWFEPGRVCEIDEETYWYFLELLPPRWMDGNWFAFGEGTGPFRLFGKVDGSYVGRDLTDDETKTFCELSRTSLHL